MARGSMKVMVGVVLASWAVAGPLEAQMHDNPFIGVWKLNVDRSVYTPGPRPPSDMTLLYQFAPLPDGSTRFTLTGNNPVGDLTFQMSVFRIDGEQRPVYNVNTLQALMTSGERTNVTRSYRRIDAGTVEFQTYTDGVSSGPVVRQLLPDGDTYVQRPASGEGNVLVFERIR